MKRSILFCMILPIVIPIFILCRNYYGTKTKTDYANYTSINCPTFSEIQHTNNKEHSNQVHLVMEIVPVNLNHQRGNQKNESTRSTILPLLEENIHRVAMKSNSYKPIGQGQELIQREKKLSEIGIDVAHLKTWILSIPLYLKQLGIKELNGNINVRGSIEQSFSIHPKNLGNNIIQANSEKKINTFYIKDFGVVADGITDDGPAIRRAINTAISSGRRARLVFEHKTYRLDSFDKGSFQIELSGINGLSIEGNKSTLLLHPKNGILNLSKCRDITFKGFVINFSPLPFTQGTIEKINSQTGTFNLKIHENYPLPPEDKIVKENNKSRGWRWGSVIDSIDRHCRRDVSDHFFIESVNRMNKKIYRIKVLNSYADKLSRVNSGDRFVLPLMVSDTGERIWGGNFKISESSDCCIEDVTIHTARSDGMNFGIHHNEGIITLRNIKIMFEPGSTHLITTHKDGIHCKDNRVGPVIENFYFEGMLDDAINISANTAMAVEVHSPNQHTLSGARFLPGNEVMVFDPVSGNILAKTKVLYTSDKIVTLADTISDVVTGNKRPEDIRSTHFYNMSYSNSGFVIRGCTFKPQRRHAMLIRCENGLIENNLIDGVGGSAIWMGNEMGNFYEGPFPRNNTICNNTIRNTQRNAIHIFTKTLNATARHTGNVNISNNTITVLPDRFGISVNNAYNVKIKKNRIFNELGAEMGNTGILVEN